MSKLRMSSVLLLGLLLLWAQSSAAWDIEWVDQFGNGIVTSATGGTTDGMGAYAAGSVFGALPGQVAAGGNDVYLRKYDVAGNVLWTRQFGTPATDFGRNVAADSTGIYFAGRTTGTLPAQLSAGDSDAFVRKYNVNGDVLWTRQFGTSGFDAPWPNGIAIHATGVYVAGETSGTFPGAPGANGVDFFIARLDAGTGQPMWIRQFGNRSNFLLTIGGVSADDSGVYVTGSTVLAQGGTALLRKYDFSGNLLWSREFVPGPGINCSGTLWGVSVHNGNVYVTGQWDQRYFDFAFRDPASGCGMSGAALGTGTTVGVLLKYDSDGNLLWTRRIKGDAGGVASFTGAKTILASATGVYVGANLTTTFAGHVADAPSSDHRECPGLIQGNSFADKLDAYVRRYDSSGNVIWTHQFGSSVFDLVNGIGTDEASVYVVGDSSCRIDSEETFSGGNRDAFVLRIAIEPSSLQGQVQLIVGQVETLSDKQRLNSGEFGSLIQHLEAALGALQADARPAVRRTLEAFVHEVDVMVDGGTLSPSEGGALAAAASDVIAKL